jgi:hypothetical protein
MTETKVVRIKKEAEQIALKYGPTVSQGIISMYYEAEKYRALRRLA